MNKVFFLCRVLKKSLVSIFDKKKKKMFGPKIIKKDKKSLFCSLPIVLLGRSVVVVSEMLRSHDFYFVHFLVLYFCGCTEARFLGSEVNKGGASRKKCFKIISLLYQISKLVLALITN